MSQRTPVLNAAEGSKFNQSLDVYLNYCMATNRALWAWTADNEDMLKSITLDNAVTAQGKRHPLDLPALQRYRAFGRGAREPDGICNTKEENCDSKCTTGLQLIQGKGVLSRTCGGKN